MLELIESPVGSASNALPETRISLGRVLVADDEESFRESTAEILREKGYDCLCATDADSALTVLRNSDVDAIIADIRMPGNSDLQVLEKIRSQGCRAPVILVTGYPSLDSAVTSVNLGVRGYLVKPINNDELFDLLERAVPAARGIRRIRRAAQQLHQLANDTEGLASCELASRHREEGPDTTRQALELAAENIVGLLLELQGFPQGAIDRAEATTPRPDVAAGVAHPLPYGDIPELAALTPREREVLTQLVGGDRVASISRELTISQNTVRNHLKSIFRKMKVGSQVELLDRLKAARGS